MSAQTNNNGGQRGHPLFKRPAGVLLDENQWKFLKKRYNLTPRELQVAILVCRGFNNNEIAESLDIMHGTVKTHLRNIYRRVRVKSKITLLLRFIEDINKNFPEESKKDTGIPISERFSEPRGQAEPSGAQQRNDSEE